MVHYAIERLLKGDQTVAANFAKAAAKWPELFTMYIHRSAADWAEWLEREQIVFFERECGGRSDGQEVMAWSGFAFIYSTELGFEDRRRQAEKLSDAFRLSRVSREVQTMAAQAARCYSV
jgi:hypothetical protein